jgi:dTDP-4-dehydrorhamnose 3,5-epimerase
MRFEESTLAGACLVTSEPACDERGFFTRTFCVREFAERGLETIFVQHSTSYNIKRGTLRGMHFQRPPHDEVKLVSCLKGAIQDVIIDLRPGSATFGCWEAFELTERNRCRLYIPKGFRARLPDACRRYGGGTSDRTVPCAQRRRDRWGVRYLSSGP